ncbi:hypothetical protein LTR08_009013 [Meristemomyces frigidus]|nr:hypothetical protein LTR08_009013 [Meristemomyces frigidus]
MSEYWKSTPSYWCKFCSTYVRDTGLERKNHEASGKHQGAIQRNLREIQKGKAIEDREKQRAKDEVARLNGLVTGGGKAGSPGTTGILGVGKATAAPPPAVNSAAQRKAHAEQLAALGVELPEDLKREVTGVGGWQVLSERVVEEHLLADIKSEQEDSKEDAKPVGSRGVHKRRAEEAEDEAKEEEAAAFRQRAWGTKTKSYPGAGGAESGADLDALLSGVTKKKPAEIKKESVEEAPEVKREHPVEETPMAAVPDVDTPSVNTKQEEAEVMPAVVFKKRKVKR